MPSLITVPALVAAGGAGALLRFGQGAAIQRAAGPGFPAGTFVVNIPGCLMFGFAMSLLARRDGLRPDLQLVSLTGFMGAFTTFSTYLAETAQLLDQARWLAAASNLILQNVLGLAALAAGLAAGRAL